MTLELNISERLFALTSLNAFKGNLDTLAYILEDIKQFVVSDEEWVKAEKTEEKNGDQFIIRWDDEKGGLKSIELNKETAKYLKDEIKKKSDSGELTLNDKAVVTLMTKLQ